MVMDAASPDPGWWDLLWPCYGCCRNIWIPSLGQFNPACIGLLSHIPLWVAVVTVVLRYAAGPAWSVRRPLWLRCFAAEEHDGPSPSRSASLGDGESGIAGEPRDRAKSWTPWTLAVLVCSAGAAVSAAMGAAVNPGHAQLYLGSFVPAIISCLMLAVERPRTAPGAVLFVNGVVLAVETALLLLMPGASPGGWPERALAWTAGCVLPLASIVVILNMPLRDPLLDSRDIAKPFTQPTHALRTPEDIITLWQWMTVSWIAPLIKLGYERQLHDEDVWRLGHQFQHTRLHALFREVKGSVFGRVLKANGSDIIITTGLGVLEMSLELSEPLLLKQLLAALASDEGPNPRTAVVYAAITLVARLVRAQTATFNLWLTRRCYERCRGELITMIHEKALRRKAFTIPSGHVEGATLGGRHSRDGDGDPAGHGDGDEPGHDETERLLPGYPTATGVSTSTTLTDDESSSIHSSASSSRSNSSSSRFNKLRSLVQRGYRSLSTPPRTVPVSPRLDRARPKDDDNDNDDDDDDNDDNSNDNDDAGSSTPDSSSPASTGRILNLVRGDAYDVSQRFWEAYTLVTKPLSLILTLALLGRILGPASLAGVLILLAGMGANVFLMRLLLTVERARREVGDVKLQRTSQFCESIRHLRWYDWQGAWLESIMAARRVELRRVVQSNLVVKAIATVNALAAYLFPVAGFWAYTVVSGRDLTVDVAFPALDLFAMLQNSLREIPDLITIMLNARVSMGRIEAFMREPEKEDLQGVDLLAAEQSEAGPPGPLEVRFRDASFSWPGVTAREVLRDVSFECRPGLTVVCGRVGIGKTALLQAVLGEMDQRGGEREVPREMVGYCAQTPWLESMSIRDNILFSAPYDRARFRKVIDACCLRDDLDKFKWKDMTLIGENGVGLSGGQRARVALARAVYSRARILLLDDPIAALDHQTATSILRNLFRTHADELTAGRLVVFVTHRVDIVAPYADQVLEVVSGGRVLAYGRAELANANNLHRLARLAQAQALPPPIAGAGEESSGGAAGTGVSDDDEAADPDRFIEEERRVHGGVVASVYWKYVKAGRLRWWCTMVVFFTLFRVVRIGYFWYLKEWGERYRQEMPAPALGLAGGYPPEPLQRSLISRAALPVDEQFLFFSGSRVADASPPAPESWFDLGRLLPSPSGHVGPWLVGFLVLSMTQVLFQTLSDASLIVIIYQAGKNMFERTMGRVAGATFRFYDVTPVGRLLNRLTADMAAIDGQIANQLMAVVFHSLGWLSSVVVISTATPVFLVISIVMTALFFITFDSFLPTSQSLRRLERVYLSPLFANIGTLAEGLTTVRAYHAEPHFQARIIASTDSFQKHDHMYWCLQAWLQYRFDILSAASSFVLALAAIASGLSGGAVGFVLAAASNFVQSTHNLCRKYGEMQLQFVSVERVVELLDVEQEPQGTVAPPAAWPSYGDEVVFDRVTLRYAPNLDPVLRDVSFAIPGGANVAVTGRTGSGKSTLALSLLGTLLPDRAAGSGTIRIGGVDVASVDKHALRRNITFVAQDPVLFPGTLRDNLDPLGEHTEAERAEVLARVLGRHAEARTDELDNDTDAATEHGEDNNDDDNKISSSSAFTLDTPVDAGGKNLSQGQRQLVGLGRAILRRSPVVILDEATASIDADTARYIQRLLREELKHSTVITIAHKAEAVQDADFEIVLDMGRVVKAGKRVVPGAK
ncbi:hypothetical protein VTJ83DRAFT_4393 [Remersonia thermophila]|uniref:ABC transporter n=1 Tax=Remersonia thermophila TaxID=72144 RepID=A0ABR4D9T7_9PEZI